MSSGVTAPQSRRRLPGLKQTRPVSHSTEPRGGACLCGWELGTPSRQGGGRHGDGSQGPRGVSNHIWETRGRFWRICLLKMPEGFQDEATDSAKAWSGSWASAAREPRASGKDWTQDEAEVRPSRCQGPLRL